MLQLDPEWQFDSPGPIPPGVANAFSQVITRISGKGETKRILEHFKTHFASAAGQTYNSSSDSSWAATDLEHLMEAAAANAPLFIDAFYTACEKLRERDPSLPVPDVKRINRILAEHKGGYQVRDLKLVVSRANRPVAVPQPPPSLDEQARALINEALASSQRALDRGDGRQAVQDLLWLLESVSTAFIGTKTTDGTVQGKYFNKIMDELRAYNRGSHRDQILKWAMTLHGFLSSPTGGGVRHGLDLRDGVAVQVNEARVYCNLIRSYVTYLIEEHERLISR